MSESLILDVNQNPKKPGHWLLFALQHILAMFVACITVPILTGLPVDATIVSAGIGTLFYILTTKRKSPVFLSSSFAYISPIISALSIGGEIARKNYHAVILGMFIVGLIYVATGFLVKAFKTDWLDKILPPIVIGPVIMVIGLGLAASAINNLTNVNKNINDYNLIHVLCGITSLIITSLAAFYGKKTVKLIPFVIGILSGYLLASLFTVFGIVCKCDYLRVVDFTPLTDNFKNVSFSSFIKIPDFIFLKKSSPLQLKDIPRVVLLFAPVALVSICEHIGDHKNLSNIIGKDLIKDPGLTRTLIGDGAATAISGILSGVANTTYGENVAVVGVSKNASVGVIILASAITILIGFVRPLMCLIQTLPGCVMGGVSLVLYGFIASSGMKMLIAEKVDFNDTKNIFVASVILVSGIGGLCLKFKGFEITEIAVAMLLGILLNVILKRKKKN